MNNVDLLLTKQRLRLLLFNIFYFIIIFVFFLFGFMWLYPDSLNIEEYDVSIDYVFDYTNCDFTVYKIAPITDINNNKGVRLYLKGGKQHFQENLYSDYSEIQEGQIYTGYEIRYTAYIGEKSVGFYSTYIYYYQKLPKYSKTFDEFKLETREKCYKEYLDNYNNTYTMLFFIYCLIIFLLDLLFIFVDYKFKYNKIRRELIHKIEDAVLENKKNNIV